MWRLIYSEKFGFYFVGVFWGAVVREGMIDDGIERE